MTVFVEPRNFEQQLDGQCPPRKAGKKSLRSWLPLAVLMLTPIIMLLCFSSLQVPL